MIWVSQLKDVPVHTLHFRPLKMPSFVKIITELWRQLPFKFQFPHIQIFSILHVLSKINNIQLTSVLKIDVPRVVFFLGNTPIL